MYSKEQKSLLIILASAIFLTTSAIAQTNKSEQTIQEELTSTREKVLSNRPYKLDPSTTREVINVTVQPSQQLAINPPDWWSEKQAYDIAALLGLALSNYSAFQVVRPITWEDHVVAINASAQPEEIIGKSKNSVATANYRTINAQIEIMDYSFQYMPVKRRGIGLGFIAITSKECSSETFLKSVATIHEVQPSNTLQKVKWVNNTGHESSIEAASVPLSRRIVNKTGGASLNLNFLVGGAGGGSFNPPDKPVKQIVYETVADAAEAMYCLATNQQACIDYYRNRPQPLATKLTDKQRKKVQSC